ncbi:hypothetical protein D3C71_2108150 [compost metagenome]
MPHDGFVMGDVFRLIRVFQRGHDVADVGRVVVAHMHRAMPDQHHLRVIGKEPTGGQPQGNFLKRAAVGVAAEEAARAPRR